MYAKQVVDTEMSASSSDNNMSGQPRITEATMCVDLEHSGIGRLVCARLRDGSDTDFYLEEYRFSISDVAASLSRDV